ncbi:hypothetical protein [Rhodopila sp.]|uniref:hypothetical protein n=1 Tax=Rhodopila sp. TaxID=2480087 RepID=UPI003D0DCAD1
MNRWKPTAKLDTLLDALEAEILSATDTEIHAALVETGRVGDATLRQVRALIMAEPDGTGAYRNVSTVATKAVDEARRHRVRPTACSARGPDRNC